jgi:hypothetical protein
MKTYNINRTLATYEKYLAVLKKVIH